MAITVPALDRSLRIMGLLSGSPDRSYTASEISATLEIPKGTCFSLLMALCDSGYLARDPERKNYTLGASCLKLSESFLRSFAGFREARGEIARLHFDLGHAALVTAPVLDEIITLATAGNPIASTPHPCPFLSHRLYGR